MNEDRGEVGSGGAVKEKENKSSMLPKLQRTDCSRGEKK